MAQLKRLMRTAAAWIHRMRVAAAREVDGGDDGAADAAKAMQPCGVCQGRAAAFGGDEGCGLCGGLGYVRADSSGGGGKEAGWAGDTREACDVHGGGSSSGGMDGDGDGTRSQGVPPELAEAWGVVGDCLAAWRAMESYGISDGLLALGGPEALAHGWHPVMLELVEELCQELSQLEHEDRKQEASRARKARQAAERRARLGRGQR